MEDNNNENNKSKVGSLRDRARQLSWMIAIFVALYILGTWNPLSNSTLMTLALSIASTFVIAFILALTIDWWAKKSLMVDVFKATIGYTLPKALRPEMEWVYKQNVIAIEHIQQCVITRINDNLLNLRIKTNRMIQNVSSASISQKIGLGIDEWFHNEKPSRIIEIGYQREGEKPHNIEGVNKGRYSLDSETEEITLAPNEKVQVWMEYEETKHNNDETHVNFLVATRRPFVSVDICEGFEYAVGFGHREKSKQMGTHRYQLSETLLPGQPINIRWWASTEADEWLKDAQA